MFFRRLISALISKRQFSTTTKHVPVMASEVIANLQPKPGQTYLDMTFGAGGHSVHILNSIRDNSVKIFALDRDPVAYKCAIDMSNEYPGQIVPLLGRFSELPSLMDKLGIEPKSIDGILFDFGCSSMQLDEDHRGFSFTKNGPLDMRMDSDRYSDSITAADLLANSTKEDLTRIFKIYGNEKQAKKIAQAIVDTRFNFKRLETTEQLSELVRNVLCGEQRFDKLNRPVHVATKIFQALRIFVNNELNEINYGLQLAYHYLKIGGRLVTLTFHSLEDTIVKRHIANQVNNNASNTMPLQYYSFNETYEIDDVEVIRDSGWQSVHKHVLVPSTDEIDNNPRSRSAKLRAAIKIK